MEKIVRYMLQVAQATEQGGLQIWYAEKDGNKTSPPQLWEFSLAEADFLIRVLCNDKRTRGLVVNNISQYYTMRQKKESK